MTHSNPITNQERLKILESIQMIHHMTAGTYTEYKMEHIVEALMKLVIKIGKTQYDDKDHFLKAINIYTHIRWGNEK